MPVLPKKVLKPKYILTFEANHNLNCTCNKINFCSWHPLDTFILFLISNWHHGKFQKVQNDKLEDFLKLQHANFFSIPLPPQGAKLHMNKPKLSIKCGLGELN